MESPSGIVGLNSGAFPHMTELLERANEIVASNPGFLDFVSQLWRNTIFLQSCETKSKIQNPEQRDWVQG